MDIVVFKSFFSATLGISAGLLALFIAVIIVGLITNHLPGFPKR